MKKWIFNSIIGDGHVAVPGRVSPKQVMTELTGECMRDEGYKDVRTVYGHEPWKVKKATIRE